MRGDDAAVLLWPRRDRYDGSPEVYRLDDMSTVIVLLADRRFEFLWQPLTKWAGPDLSLLRERMRRQAAAISDRVMSLPPRLPAESVTSPRLSDFIRLTAIYMQIGQGPLAEKVMETYVGYAGTRGLDSQETVDWILAKLRLATVMQFNGKVEPSFRQYEDVRHRVGRSEHALNASINYAAVLAEHGHYARALDMIQSTWAKFTKVGDEAIAGSERHFAWIRACALDGLGRPAEADAAYQVLRRSGDVTDTDFIVDAKETIEWRGQWCRRREPLIKAYLIEQLTSGRTTYVLMALQPAYRPFYEDPVLLAKLRADPDVQAAMAKRMRALPASMVPAINYYR